MSVKCTCRKSGEPNIDITGLDSCSNCSTECDKNRGYSPDCIENDIPPGVANFFTTTIIIFAILMVIFVIAGLLFYKNILTALTGLNVGKKNKTTIIVVFLIVIALTSIIATIFKNK